MIWNALDYTALVIPTGLSVDPLLDAKKPAHEFFTDLDKANHEFCQLSHNLFSGLYLKLTFCFPDDPAIFKDAPLCIQVVGRTLEEEGVIAIGEVVDAALKAKLSKSNL